MKFQEAKRGQEQALVRYNKNMNDITLKYVNMLVHTQQSSVLHSAYTRKQRILEEAKETLQILLVSTTNIHKVEPVSESYLKCLYTHRQS